MEVVERVGKGTLLWVPEKHGHYGLGEVVQREGSMLRVKMVKSDASFSLDLDDPDIALLKANSLVVPDMTSLQHLHLPSILHNLRERALQDEPYTFLGGSVLVAVNPLRPVPEPKGALGSKKATQVPHPYAIAEGAYQQMCFAASRKRSAETPTNQSILVSGESGAGKTESSKMVLRHLVRRCLGASSKSSENGDLDRRLLDSNPILEAFGNAATKRNHNSSRFGKFLKLHFQRKKGKAGVQITGASVETYLLERSRVTQHGEGERGFHVFYHLVSGASKSQRASLGLDQPFTYLRPRERVDATGGAGGRPRGKQGGEMKRSRSMRISLAKLEEHDKTYFGELCTALETVGVPKSGSGSAGTNQTELFGVLAALLHLGNVEFVDDSSTAEGNVATPKDARPLNQAAALLGVKSKRLHKLLVERKVKAVGEEIITKRDAANAKVALDAVVKTVYVKLFEWLVGIISSSLSRGEAASAGSTKKRSSFIGVLDIFGFESFKVNDFEQLLINYTNEALQSSFNKQVFEAEAELYEKEGLLVSQNDRQAPLDNSKCMQLLRGAGSSAKGASKQLGILGIIDAEGHAPQPLDEKMNAALHRSFKGHDNFPAPHPRDVRSTFIVRHFAGEVKYTVGHFLEKNQDKVPHEVDELFQGSELGVVAGLFTLKEANAKDKLATARRTVRGMNSSVISRFKNQIDKLLATLGDTRCSFIRCVKPNPHMLREDKDPSWFDDNYVTNQLENLSIPQTTQVLRGGLPTRVPYELFVESYRTVLPKEAVRVWQTLGQGDERGFVTALFYAFNVEPSTYKLGLTRVFFRSGQLEQLTDVLEQSTSGKIDEAVVERFRKSFARMLWRRAYAKVLAINRFQALLRFSRARDGAVTILQRVARRKLAELEAKAELAKLREEKRKTTEAEAKRRAKEARRTQKEVKKKADEAAAKKAREAEVLRLEEAALEQRAREQEKLAREAAAEQARVKEYRQKAEKEAKAARKVEKDETRRTIERCGGEKGYLAQKQKERAVQFSDDIVVTEFEPYLTEEHMEPEGDDANQAYLPNSDEATLMPGEDLQRLSKTIKVVMRSSTRAAGKAMGLAAGLAGGKGSQGTAQPAAGSVVPPRRWSYASPVEPKADSNSSELGEDISQEGVWVAEPSANSVLAQVQQLERSGGRGGRPKKNAANKLACMLGSARQRASQRMSAARGRGSPGGAYAWQESFLSLKGFMLQYFSDSMKDDGQLVGVDRRGGMDMSRVRELKRYTRLEEDPRLGLGTPPPQLKAEALLRVRHPKGRDLLLAFASRKQCDDWTAAIERARRNWKEEVRAMRKFEKGKYRSDQVKEYREMLGTGLISKKDYKIALAQQVSTDLEHIEQSVAIYGDSAYDDKRAICEECRAVNFLVDAAEDGGYWCFGCGSEITNADGMYGAGLNGASGGGGRGRSTAAAHKTMSVPAALASLVQPVEPADDASEAISAGRWPLSVALVDGSILTVNQGELIGRPRFDVNTGTKKYYFSFPCQFEEKRNKRNVRYWHLDYPHASFMYVRVALQRDLDEANAKTVLPEIAPDPSNVTDPKELARARLHNLNKFMEELLALAQKEPLVFRSKTMRYFFQVAENVKVAPLPLGELQDLADTFVSLSNASSLSKGVFLLYKSVQSMLPRIESSADPDVVFNTTDSPIAELSASEKGEMFSIAQDYITVLEAFESRFRDKISALS